MRQVSILQVCTSQGYSINFNFQNTDHVGRGSDGKRNSTCKGRYGDANLYEGRIVVVLYYTRIRQDGSLSMVWFTNGIVELEGVARLQGTAITSGLKYDAGTRHSASQNGSLPAICSRVILYMAPRTDLSVEVGNDTQPGCPAGIVSRGLYYRQARPDQRLPIR